MVPTVSVVIPTFNRGALLLEAVQSVIAQTWTDWELIVVDDGSTDCSLDTVEALRDSRLRLVRLRHSGSPARARNAGAAVARGEWIAFLDSDDRWRPEKLSGQLAALGADPLAEWSCTDHGFIDDNGSLTPQRAGTRYRATSGWVLGKLLRREATVALLTVLVRRTTLDRIGGFDERFPFRDDLDVILRLAASAPLRGLAELLADVRVHPTRSTSSQSVVEMLETNARVYEHVAVSIADPVLQRLCRRLAASNRVDRARRLVRNGRYTKALAILASIPLRALRLPVS